MAVQLRNLRKPERLAGHPCGLTGTTWALPIFCVKVALFLLEV